MSEEKVDGGKRIATSNEQRVTSDEKGERDEAVGRGPRARRFSGNERNQANGTTRAVPAPFFGLFGEQSLQRNSPYIGEQPTLQACM